MVISLFQNWKGNKTIERIDFTDCIRLTGRMIENSVNNLPVSLTSLKLSKCSLTDDSLKILSTNFPGNLVELEIESCVDVSDSGLIDFCKRFSKIKVLNINNCEKVTKDFLFALPQLCPSIQKCHVRLCADFRFDDLMEFIKKTSKTLEVLWIAGLLSHQEVQLLINESKLVNPRLQLRW
eukprot:c8439_g1_i1.p1 GENE.c8439_g1_i1~~c8439_g1_i1.p1  ORF type:complete len:180 (+),score=69.69 c8439_g1_i1:467-1006(+)